MSTAKVSHVSLKKGSTWRFEYYQINPKTGIEERFRPTQGINRIKNLERREIVALKLLKELQDKVDRGFPFTEQRNYKEGRTIETAINFTIAIKQSETRKKNSIDTIRSGCNVFFDFLRTTKRLSILPGAFTQAMAVEFLDYVVMDRKGGARTYNNYKIRMHTQFEELRKRKMITSNPFAEIPKRKVAPRKKREFDDADSRLIALHIKRTDPMLFLAIQFIYYTAIRPGELIQLRVYHVDLVRGCRAPS
ncbi:MAG: hypothetical protein ABIV51_04595 [Saprospiraceae bacterium]